MSEARGRKPCCLISAFLEEAGLDRAQLRRARRQVLEGIMLLCQWQLQRMDTSAPPSGATSRKGRRVKVE